MLFSLTVSTTPVTTLVVKLNGTEQDRLTGSDLRKVAGSYWQVPPVRGTYRLTVEAFNAAGCKGEDARPMTVVVK